MARDLTWLKESFRAIDRVYFGDALAVQGYKVLWMPWRPNKKVFIFGRCYKEQRVIKINRALQHDWVPDYVVLSTLYHEMLHVVIGDDHDMTFELAEEKFVHFAKSNTWEDQNLTALLTASKPT